MPGLAPPPDALLAQAVLVSAYAVFCQDASGRVTTWNSAAERLYDQPAVDLLGRCPAEVLPGRTGQELRAAHATAMTGVRVEPLDSSHRRRDGTTVPVTYSAVPLLDGDGTVVGVATTVADVTERVELAQSLSRTRQRLERQNAALLRSNRDLEQFAYVASHDLSEPLRVMTGFVGRLEHRYVEVLDERGLRYMRHVVDAATRMRALVDDLLEYARFLQAPRELALVDTDAVLARVLATLAGPLRTAGALVRTSALPPVWSDAAQLESLLSNLVSNACKFRREGSAPQIAVGGDVQDGWVNLTVDDDGIGIDQEYRERVFRMFQRLHVREAYAGTGIGLAIAQQIVEVQGGRIGVEDSPLGGARFRVVLPAAAPDAEDDRA